MKPEYNRILLKLSGEYLGGQDGNGFDFSVIKYLTKQIEKVRNLGIQTAIVLGGGNFFRGTKNIPMKMDRVAADHIGMLATIMNAVCLKEALSNRGLKSTVMTGLETPDVAEAFNKKIAVNSLEQDQILVFAGGTGRPYFSTDTAAVLRALEIEADIVIKGTKVNGVYDKDPVQYDTAKRFDKLTFSEVLERDLKVMDSAAIALCRENQLPLCVLSISNKNDLLDFVKGKKVGTTVNSDFR